MGKIFDMEKEIVSKSSEREVFVWRKRKAETCYKNRTNILTYANTYGMI